MKRTLLILFVSLLSACTPVKLNRQPLYLPDPPPVRMKPVTFTVILPEMCSDGSPTGNVVYYAVDEAGYKNLAENVKAITNFMTIQGDILQRYRDYYEGNVQGRK